jgi:hypothetical protein
MARMQFFYADGMNDTGEVKTVSMVGIWIVLFSLDI